MREDQPLCMKWFLLFSIFSPSPTFLMTTQQNDPPFSPLFSHASTFLTCLKKKKNLSKFIEFNNLAKQLVGLCLEHNYHILECLRPECRSSYMYMFVCLFYQKGWYIYVSWFVKLVDYFILLLLFPSYRIHRASQYSSLSCLQIDIFCLFISA